MALLELIKAELKSIEKLDLKATPAIQLAEKLKRISDFLAANKNQRDIHFTKQFVKQINRALEYHNAVDLGVESLLEKHGYMLRPKFLTEERVYAGRVPHEVSGGKFLKVKPDYNHFSLSRSYGNINAIIIEWELGSEGRIQSVVYRLIRSENKERLYKTNQLIVVEPQTSEEWNEALAEFGEIPEETRELNPGFKDLKPYIKLRNLLRFCYADIRELIRSLNSRNTKADSHPRDGEMPLHKILNDKEALYMLSAAVDMPFPNVFLKENQRMLISYD